MASTSTTSFISPLLTPTHRRPIHSSLCTASSQASPPRHVINSRRECLLLILTATTTMTALNSPSANAADIPLFGLRKKLETAEKEAVELVKEGFESAEKGIDTVEKGVEAAEGAIQSAEKNIESAGKGIENAAAGFNFSGAAQAGFVAGAELLGVLIATAIVNGILGPEPQKS